jgi:hypothetical protein
VVPAAIMPTDMAPAAAKQIPAAVLDMQAIRRIATLEEMAASVIYLLAPGASYIKGSTIDLCSGALFEQLHVAGSDFHWPLATGALFRKTTIRNFLHRTIVSWWIKWSSKHVFFSL